MATDIKDQLNHLNITRQLSGGGPAKIEVILQPAVTELWMNVLRTHYDLAMMQGEQIITNDGCTILHFQVSDEEAILFRSALMQAYTIYSGFNTCN